MKFVRKYNNFRITSIFLPINSDQLPSMMHSFSMKANNFSYKVQLWSHLTRALSVAFLVASTLCMACHVRLNRALWSVYKA